MIAEGTVADGPNGQTAVYTGGKWVVQGTPALAATNPLDQKRVADLRTQADDSGRVAGLANDFMAINKSNATGPGYSPVKVPLPLMGSVNINPTHGIMAAVNSDLPAMESITNRAAVQLRPTGSGPLRNVELANFMKAFPNIQNLGEGNQKITGQLQTEAQTKRAYSDFMAGWLAKTGSLTGADEAWQARNKAPPPNTGGGTAKTPYRAKNGYLVHE